MEVAQTLNRSMALKDSSQEHWDETEFRAVFLQYYARIVDVLVRLLGDPSHAEDLANDALWRLYRQPRLQVEGNVGGWLYRTATNLGLDALRTSGRRRHYEETAGQIAKQEQSSVSGEPLANLLREEKSRRVRNVLSLIKPVHSQLLILRSSGLSYKELAEALVVKPSGIGTMLNRAGEEFRERYLALHPNGEEL